MAHNTINLHTAKKYVALCLESGLVPFLRSSPGIGKSSIVKEIADTYNLELIDLRLSQCDPTDLQGLPKFENDKAKFIPFDTFPLEGAPLPEGKNGVLLFLDEFNSASRAVSAAAYKLVLDRKVGNFNLSPDVYIVCAGNLDTDKAITNPMSTALTSRLVNLFIDVDTDDWVKHYAIPNGLDKRIIAYLSMKPSSLMTFDPNIKQDAYASPRTWEFLSKLLANIPSLSDSYTPLIAGIVGEASALDFLTFSKHFESLPDFKQILQNPTSTPVPDETPVKWAVTTCLVDNLLQVHQHQSYAEVRKHYTAYATYMERFDITFRIMFFRMVLSQLPELIQEKATHNVAQELKEYVLGD